MICKQSQVIDHESKTLPILFAGFSYVAPGFKNKTRYTPYVSSGSQISHIATNKGNINSQCLLYNILSIKDITLDSKQRKDTPFFRRKLQIHRDNRLVEHEPKLFSKLAIWYPSGIFIQIKCKGKRKYISYSARIT